MTGKGKVEWAMLVLCATCGCGAIGNLSHFSQSQPFGGTRRDIHAATDLYGDAAGPEKKKFEDWTRYVVAAPFLLVDLPLSVAADAVTLPLTLPMTWYRSAHPESSERPEKPPTPAATPSPAPSPSAPALQP